MKPKHEAAQRWSAFHTRNFGMYLKENTAFPCQRTFDFNSHTFLRKSRIKIIRSKMGLFFIFFYFLIIHSQHLSALVINLAHQSV